MLYLRLIAQMFLNRCFSTDLSHCNISLPVRQATPRQFPSLRDPESGWSMQDEPRRTRQSPLVSQFPNSWACHEQPIRRQQEPFALIFDRMFRTSSSIMLPVHPFRPRQEETRQAMLLAVNRSTCSRILARSSLVSDTAHVCASTSTVATKVPSKLW